MNQASVPSGSWLSHPRRRDYWLITFILLLVLLALRLYLPVGTVGIRFDEAKYLGVARNLPQHHLPL